MVEEKREEGRRKRREGEGRGEKGGGEEGEKGRERCQIPKSLINGTPPVSQLLPTWLQLIKSPPASHGTAYNILTHDPLGNILGAYLNISFICFMSCLPNMVLSTM
jgi:hypothetical protein